MGFAVRKNRHARLENSARLQRVLEVLKDGKWHTSLEIAMKARTVAPGSCISELRTNGFDIECRYRETTEDGRRVFEYRLKREEQKDAGRPF